jgi:hypothetical protein
MTSIVVEEYNLIMRRLGGAINALITAYVPNGNKGDGQTGLVAIRKLKQELNIDATFPTFRTKIDEFLSYQDEKRIITIARLLVLSNRERRKIDKKSFQNSNDIIITAIKELNTFNQKYNIDNKYVWEDLVKSDIVQPVIQIKEKKKKKKILTFGGDLSPNDTILAKEKDVTLVNKIDNDPLQHLESGSINSELKNLVLSILTYKSKSKSAQTNIIKLALRYSDNLKRFVTDLIWSYHKKYINAVIYNEVLRPVLIQYNMDIDSADKKFNVKKIKTEPTQKSESVDNKPSISMSINTQPRKSAEARLYELEIEVEKLKNNKLIVDDFLDSLHYLVNLIKAKMDYENR